MGRYRPPPPPKSKHITAAGAARLRAELKQLWEVKRPQVTRAVAEAAAQGDRSENAEYIYGKKQLREIDRRVRYLTKRLDELVVVDRMPDDQSRVFFGAWVRLEDEAGDEAIYRIVGADEYDMDAHYISLDSPLARALLGKREGEEIEVQLPKGSRRFVIVEVGYAPLG
ncbi:MAG: transcription elongation factor GreB [Gammaproteobacteria bacterium SG8_47]|nr:MAG: transcription elongation factor GreB [Gammaproteobacteria bacterium SG8_47]